MATLKFYYNGIKVDGGKLQKAWYSDGCLRSHPEGTLTIYARDYCHFSKEIGEVFSIENDSDLYTDYFDKDRIRVEPSHSLYQQVKAAYEAQVANRQRRAEKRSTKLAA